MVPSSTLFWCINCGRNRFFFRFFFPLRPMLEPVLKRYPFFFIRKYFFIEICLYPIGRPGRHFQGKFQNTNFNKNYAPVPVLFVQFENLSTWAWHVPRNLSGPRKFVRCRRLLKGREVAIARGRTTAAVAARPLKTLSTS